MSSPSNDPPSLAELAERLAGRLRAARRGELLVVTGAGVSVASGLATFRGDEPDAVWRVDDVSMATVETFHRDPVGQWRWYLDRFDTALGAEPNAAHRALAALERWQAATGGFLLVTQNVDTLHERAGSQRLVKVHGTADRFRCSREGCRLGAPAGSLPREEVDLAPFRAEPSLATLPACPECGAPLRAHSLFFDEYYAGHRDFQWERVTDAAERADLVVTAGTSHAVGVTELVLRAALARRVPVVVVDPARRPLPRGVERLPATAEQLLPAACEILGVAPEGGRTV